MLNAVPIEVNRVLIEVATATEEGIRSVKGAGDELVKIGTALESFAGLKNPTATARKISNVLGLVRGMFAAVAGDDSSVKAFGFTLATYDDGLVEKGIARVQGAGATLTEIATGIKAFDGFDSVAVAKSIGTLLTSVGTAFIDLYKTNPEVSPQLKDFATFIVTLGDVAEKGLLDKAADGISKIADSINKIDIDKTVAFGDLFTSSAKLSDDNDAYKALAKAVEDIRDMMGEASTSKPTTSDKLKNLMGVGEPSTARPAGAEKKGADPMQKLNSTLASLSQAITNLPGDIASAEFVVKLQA